MYFFNGFSMYGIVFLIPAIIFALYAQFKVKSTFGKYNSIRLKRGITGAEAASRVLAKAGLSQIQIVMVQGSLTDFYDPTDKTLHLSEAVYNTPTIGAVSVACHEVGHAIQDNKRYLPLKLRNQIVPLVNITNSMVWPLVFIGVILLSVGNMQFGSYGIIAIDVAIICLIAVTAFHAITLPVELDASHRALVIMRELNLVDSEEEYNGAKKVLNAAAMTYIAALAMSLANLLRLIAIRSSRD